MKKLALPLILIMLLNLLPIVSHAAGANPYMITQGADWDYVSVTPSVRNDGVLHSTDLKGGAYAVFESVNFGSLGAYRMDATIGALLDTPNYLGGTMEVRLDSKDGKVIANFTASANKRVSYTYMLEEAVTGVHDLYFVFTGSGTKAVCLQDFIFYEYAKDTQQFVFYSEPDYLKDIVNYGKKDMVYTLIELGLIEPFLPGEYNPYVGITRGNYAKTIAKIMGNPLSGPQETGFTDIDPSGDYASSVAHLQSLGVIKGTGNGTFNPDVYITVADALTMAVRALGYENIVSAQGGAYPMGYINQASRIGLAKGLTSQDKLTRGDLVTLVDNIINADYLDLTGIQSDEGLYTKTKGILSSTMNYYTGEGTVKANTFTTLVSPINTVGDNKVIIDDEEYYVGSTYAASLIGYDVTFYYKEENNKKTLISVSPSNNVKVTVADTGIGDGISTLTEREFSYYSAEKDTVKTIPLSSKTHIIYNGKAIDSPLDTLLEPGDFRGVVRYVEGSDDTTLVIEEYVSVWAKSIIPSKYQVYDGLTKKNVVFDAEENDVAVFLGGSGVQFTAVPRNSILNVYESKNQNGPKLIRINVCTDSISGSITEISDDYIAIDGNQYQKSKNATQRMDLGVSGYFLLNDYGEITAYSESASNVNYRIGVFSAAKLGEGLNKKTSVQIFEDNNELTVYKCSDNIIIDGFTIGNQASILSGDGKFAGLNNMDIVNTLIRYRVNEANEITMIDTYLTGNDSQEDTFTRLTNPNTVFQYNGSSKLFVHASSSLSIAPYKATPAIFGFETAGDIESLFYDKNLGLYAKDSKVVDITGEVYTLDKNKPYVSHVIWQGVGGADTWGYPFVVEKKVSALVDDEEVIKIIGKRIGETVEYYIPKSIYDNPTGNMVTVKKIVEHLNPGDAIRVVSTMDGEISNCQLKFLANGAATNPAGIEAKAHKEKGLGEISAVSRWVGTIYGEVVDILDDFIKVEYSEGEYEYVRLPKSIMRYDYCDGKTQLMNAVNTAELGIGDKVLCMYQEYEVRVLCVYEHPELN